MTPGSATSIPRTYIQAVRASARSARRSPRSPSTSPIATKGGYNGGGLDRLREEIDQSLESLRTDSIDLFYLHRIDPDTPLEETLGLLAELRDEGKLRNIGISDVSIGEIGTARGVVEIAAVQNEFNLDRQDDDAVDLCAGEGIAYVPFFPLRGGGRAVDEIASAHCVSANAGEDRVAAQALTGDRADPGDAVARAPAGEPRGRRPRAVGRRVRATRRLGLEALLA